MGITLSQSFRRPMGQPIWLHARRPLSIIATLLLLTTTTGCNRVESEKTPEIDATDAPTSFEWPDDPGHPRLTLEIESGASEDGEAGKKVTGTIEIELMPELAPATVAHVIRLAKDGYYDGTTFHRVIPEFMIQGGDPNSRDRDPSNDGNGDPSMRITDEFGDAPFLRGVVGMANLGRRDTTDSQFFIMHADDRSLDGRYTVVGRVVSGIEVVDSITQVSIDRIGRWGPRNRPIENVLMNQVAVREGPMADKEQVSTRTAAEDDASS